jgi:hypothetical protein
MRSVVALLLFMFYMSCTTRPVEPTRSSRHTIDTLFQKEIISLQAEMDSMCAKMYDSLFMSNVDSLMTIRRAEMNILVE